jgi:hypothetical protein
MSKIQNAILSTLAQSNGASYIGGNAQNVNSIAALRLLLKGSPSSKAYATGYYTQGDGGGGTYYYDAADTTTADNGGTVIVAADGGRWKLATQGIIGIRQFGAKGDASTNDTTAFNNAIAAMNAGAFKILYVAAGIYNVTGALTTVTADGVSFWFEAANGATCRIDQQSGSNNTLTFSPTSPSTSRINDIGLHNVTIWNNAAAPTAGVGLTLIRTARLKASNVDIRNHFKGINIVGGAEQEWTNVAVSGAYTWAAPAAGSRGMLVQIASYGAVNEVPSELFFTNVNCKGVTTGGVNNYLDIALEIQAGDGIWFANGHVGFANTASILIQPAGTSTYLDSIEFTSVYLDGSFGGTGVGLQVFGAAAGPSTNIKFASCVFKNHKQHGIQVGGSGTVSGIRFEGGNVENNGAFGAIVSGTVIDANFNGTNFYNNNTANSSADCISILGGTGVRVQNSRIRGGTYNYASGINVQAAATNVILQNNHLTGCNTNIINLSSTAKLTGNWQGGGLPTIASAASLPVPLGIDTVVVSGTTTITSIAGGNYAGMEVTLIFQGVLTVTKGANIGLSAAGGNMVTTSGSILKLINDGTVWREVARTVA